MSKKITKTLLSSSLVVGLLSVSSFTRANEYSYSALDVLGNHGSTYTIVYNSDSDTAYVKWKKVPSGVEGIKDGDIVQGLSKINKDGTVEVTTKDGTSTYRVYDREFHNLMNSLVKQDKENTLGKKDGTQTDLVSDADIRNLFGRIAAISEMETNVGLDEYGRVATSAESIKERVSLQTYLATEAANSAIGLDKNGKLTLNETDIVTPLRINDGVVTIAKDVEEQKEGLAIQKKGLSELSSRTDIIDAATAANTNKIDSRTTVGVNADGTLTSADGATKTIAVNDGLVALSGRTDRIDAAVGSVDRRVTKNTQAIQSNTRQLQEHNARLNSQQRQIRENHEEMKRAAAQSAALAGLFQPYSVGKFNATAALGGYSDKQAVAVGVGYRFNEQTAAKAGVAASDGDVSYNVGVNFEF
ncbi:YadA C-terminal domain-containing protein [Escherichia coli]|nr:YadA-like family protein [Escherichia coli]EKB6064704.1 YadA-like family protein [Escherichia coli]EKD4670213.1 YadA-like family protein [Escherichia coli]HDP1710327.1 YadA-like family protein [Escherichia coli]